METMINKVLVEDCIEGMQKISDNSVDLIIADPPYNLNKDFGIWKETEKKDVWLL